MANRRMVDAGLFEDDFIGTLDFFGRVLWIGLFAAVADDQGRCLDNAAIIRAKVFPFDTVTDDQVEAVLVRLADGQKITRYTVGHKRLLQINHWWTYQNPSWASESRFAAPEGWSDRVKCHVPGNKVLTLNWDGSGGFAGGVHSGLHSPLPSQLDRPIEEIKIKSESKSESEDKQEQGSATAAAPAAVSENIFRLYEQNIGIITRMMVPVLMEAEKTYPYEWLVYAFQEAVTHNKRNWRYVEAILKRCEAQGIGAPKQGEAAQKAQAPGQPASLSYLDRVISGEGG